VIQRRVDTKADTPLDHPVSRIFGEMRQITLPAWSCVRVRMWWTDDGPVKEIDCANEKVARDFVAMHIKKALTELDTRYWLGEPENAKLR
jgi:hypothetical protein